MRCVAEVVDGIKQRTWVHHIKRLAVLGNLAMLAGVSPPESARPLLSTGEADNGSIERQFVLMRPSRGVGLEGQLASRLES
jgi:hypothetical protein